MPKIKNYAVRLGRQKIGAIIHLFDENNKMVAHLSFLPAKKALPEDDNENYMKIHLPLHMLNTVIDILRNESPVYVQWNQDQNCGFLSTSAEPVGEGEN